MRRYTPYFVATLSLVMIFTALIPTRGQAAIVDTATSLQELVIGQKNAPVTIIEYASLGCPHCANFHKNTYPLLKKNYIDTGKVKMIYRDFPLGTSALAAAMIARCSGPKRRSGMIELFYRSQADWGRAENPLQALIKVARFGGLNEQDVKACIGNQKLIKGVRDRAAEATDKFGIDSTPSFIVNGTVIRGNIAYDDLKSILDEILN